MKTSSNLITVVALLFAFSSCKKINESIQRDVDITTDAIEFTIPPIVTTDSATVLGNFNVNMNVDELIKTNAPQFDINNVRTVKITGFKIDLLDDDEENNFANLENIDVQIWTDANHTSIAGVPANPNMPDSSLTLQISGGGIELKDYVTAPSFRYNIKGKARKITTKALKAKATAQYKFTVGK